jgi:hypothetical protein
MNHLQGGCLKLQSEAFVCSTEIFNFSTRCIFEWRPSVATS